MTPEIAILIAQMLVKYGPAVAREVKLLLQKKDPTLEDWEKVFALAEKPYEAYIAEAKKI